jgi:hypothetical protein
VAGAAARYGETGAAAYLLPLSVDWLILVANASLIAPPKTEVGCHHADHRPHPVAS